VAGVLAGDLTPAWERSVTRPVIQSLLPRLSLKLPSSTRVRASPLAARTQPGRVSLWPPDREISLPREESAVWAQSGARCCYRTATIIPSAPSSPPKPESTA
jgi:hypothetical protein